MKIFNFLKEKATIEFNAISSQRGSSKAVIYKDEKFENYIDIYRGVPDVYASVESVVDHLLQTWFRIEGGSDTNRKDVKSWVRAFSTREFIAKFIRSLLTTGNIFLDIRIHPKKKNVIHKILIVDPDTIEIERDKYATKCWFYQCQLDGKRKLLKNLVHVSYNTVNDKEVYGRPEFVSILTVLNAKLNIENDIVSVVHNFAYPLIHWKLGTKEFPANNPSITKFTNTLNALEGRDIITGTDVEGAAISPEVLKMDLPIDLFERQIVAGLRIPGFLLERAGGSPEALKIQIDAYFRKIYRIAYIISRCFEVAIFTKLAGVEPDSYGWFDNFDDIPSMEWNVIETSQDKMVRISQLHGTSPVIDTDEARKQLGYDGEITLSDSQVLEITNGATNDPKGSSVVNAGNPQSGQAPVTPSQKATPSLSRKNVDRGKSTDIKKTNR